MTTKDLIAGYATYTDANELGIAGAPAAASIALPPTSPFSTDWCTVTMPPSTVSV